MKADELREAYLVFFQSKGCVRRPSDVLVPRWGEAEALGDLGTTPFFATFFVVVSIHHYFMDTVLWRRDMPETRLLMADAPARA